MRIELESGDGEGLNMIKINFDYIKVSKNKNIIFKKERSNTHLVKEERQ